MGLDMYLDKETYIGANWEHNHARGEVTITVDRGEEPYTFPIQFNRVSTIREHVGYWRKANAIHKWFVDNCQDGVDECQDTYVYPEALKELLELCKKVKANPELAEELLPTQAGFFFGSTEYDEWYFYDIDETIKILEAVLGEPDADNAVYVYHSSW